MPNDFEVIKAFVLNGDNQSAHNHLMFHYRQDDEMRHALLTAIYEDPEVKYLYDTTPDISTLGGWGKGGIFEGGDKKRLAEHLAQQDQNERAALQDKARQEQANLGEQSNTSDSGKDPLLENDNLSNQDLLVEQDILNQKAESNPSTFSLSPDGEEMTLPNELPRTGQGSLKLSPDGPDMILPDHMMGEENREAYNKLFEEKNEPDLPESLPETGAYIPNNDSEAQYGQGSLSGIEEQTPLDYNLSTDENNSDFGDYKLDIDSTPVYTPNFESESQYGQGSMNNTEDYKSGIEDLPDIFDIDETGLSTHDFWALSNASYHADDPDNFIPAGFKLHEITVDDNGYEMHSFINENTFELVMAFKGSDPPKTWNALETDWERNMQTLRGKVHDQMNNAWKDYDEYLTSLPGYKIHLTGHSLGGYLAENLASTSGNQAVTFDPLYAGNLTGDYPNIVRVLPSGNGVWKLTADIHINGAFKVGSKYSGYDLYKVMNNHSLIKIGDEIVDGTAITYNEKDDYLNPLADILLNKSNLFKEGLID